MLFYSVPASGFLFLCLIEMLFTIIGFLRCTLKTHIYIISLCCYFKLLKKAFVCVCVSMFECMCRHFFLFFICFLFFASYPKLPLRPLFPSPLPPLSPLLFLHFVSSDTGGYPMDISKPWHIKLQWDQAKPSTKVAWGNPAGGMGSQSRQRS